MNTIAELLTPETRQRLAEIPFVVTKKATDPNPPRRPLTAADAIDIDPLSEALIEADCVDCHDPVLIDPKVPEGVDPEMPRVPICRDCARIRALEAARTQRNVLTVRRTTVARHQPRVTDGIKHPVTIQTPVQKESDVIDLDNSSDAEFGASVRESLRTEIASEIPAKRKKAKKKLAKAEAKKEVLKKRDRATRRGVVLPEFTLHGVTVPALDLSDVTDMGEVVSAKQRSPYNKVLHRNGEPLLPAGDKDDPIAPVATYADVAEVHKRLSGVEPKKAKKGQRLVAHLDVDAPAKDVRVQALMEAMPHLSKKQAKAILAKV